MDKLQVLEAIQGVGLVPVLRAPSQGQGLAIAEALSAGGATVLEITMTVPGALPLIRALAQSSASVVIGAGTVLDPETARLCILEGAQFIVSPALNLATVEMCNRYSIPVLPGALTPTEVLAAWQAGADAVKVFPISAMGGAPYLKSLLAPFPHIKLVPTGGISLGNAEEFLEAGAFALGVGAELVSVATLEAHGPEAITRMAAQYVETVARWKRARVPSAS